MRLLAILLLASIPALPQSMFFGQNAPPFGFNGFAHYVPIVISSTLVIGTQTNYIMTIDHTDLNLRTVANGGYVTSSSCFDCALYSDICVTRLTWDPPEIYNATTGHVIFSAVNVGTVVNGSSETVNLCTGNSAISGFQGGLTGAAWPAAYRMVWHLGNGASLSVADSTTNANSGGTPSGDMAATAGKIDGGAVNTTGRSLVSSFTNPVLGTPSNAATLSFWINWSSLAGLGEPFDAVSLGYQMYYSSSKLHWAVDSDTDLVVSGTTFSTGTWYKIDATYDGTTALIYVNGAQDNTATISRSMSSNTSVSVMASNAASSPCTCTMDEVRFSSGVNPLSRITTDYNNQNAPDTFGVWGSWH